MAAMSTWLGGHVEWIRHHSAGHDAIDELVTVVNQARRTIDVPPHRTVIPVGPCPEEPDGLACHGEIRAYIPNTEDEPAHMTCTHCGVRYEAALGQWNKRLGRRIAQRRELIVNGARVTITMGTTRGTARIA
jgi:hypothetical protein